MMLGKLNVAVRTFTQRGPHITKVLTEVLIRMGEMPIADRIIPGRWNQAQALKEFRRFPDRFRPCGDFDRAKLNAVAA